MHRAVTLALRKEAVELLTCDNGQDALRLALEHRPAVVLADLDMPGLTGVELCRSIRQEPLLRNTKVVLLCGSFDQVDEARLESAEADGRLWKPFEAHVLVALLTALLKSPVREPVDTTGNISDIAQRMTEETFSVERKVISAQPTSTSPTAPRIRIPDPESATLPPVPLTPWPSQDSAEYLSETPTAPPIASAPPPPPHVSEEPTYAPPAREEFLRVDTAEFLRSPPPADTNVSSAQATENLWSAEFQPLPVSEPDPVPADEEDPDLAANFDPIYLRSDLEKATRDSQRGIAPTTREPRESYESTLPPVKAPPAPAPAPSAPPATPADAWLSDSDLSQFRSSAQNFERSADPLRSMSSGAAAIPPAAAPAPGIPEERLRSLIREEIDDAFRGWLRARLQEKLDLVLAEIDRE
jgi:CheY-like chemotaxis protein